MIRMLEGLPDGVIGFEAIGEVHGKDYRDVIDPALEQAISQFGRVRLLYLLGDEFAGYTLPAMLDDAAVGTRDWSHMSRIAVVSETEWVRAGVHAFAWMVPGRIHVYSVSQRSEAEAWLAEQ